MNKKWIIVAIILFAIALGAGFYFYKVNNASNNNSNYETEKTATNNNNTQIQTNEQENENTNSEEEAKKQQEEKNKQEEEKAAKQKAPVEVQEIATFSTKIYSKDSARQNNISITCSTLNNTDVANGQTFSFCNTVGQSSSSKGYQKADIYTNGEKTKGYGGGNCQISTTLYNAVLKVPGLKVTERHEHSNDVPYIQDGKDAAVAYGSYDFKFVNNTGNSIRIKAEASNSYVNIKLIKLE